MDESKVDNPTGDGIDRRGFLKCMAWAGTGLVWAVSGGILSSRVFAQDAKDGQGAPPRAGADFTFVQISDSHVGFAKEPNKDVIGTFQEAVRRINAMPVPPAFILHT